MKGIRFIAFHAKSQDIHLWKDQRREEIAL